MCHAMCIGAQLVLVNGVTDGPVLNLTVKPIKAITNWDHPKLDSKRQCRLQSLGSQQS